MRFLLGFGLVYIHFVNLLFFLKQYGSVNWTIELVQNNLIWWLRKSYGLEV